MRRLPRRRCRQYFDGDKYFSIFVQFLFGVLLLLQDIKHGLSDSTFQSRHPDVSWYDGFNKCQNAVNLTMPSAEVIYTKNWSAIADFLPIWVYAFEVKYKEKYYAVSNLQKTASAKSICDSEKAEFEVYGTFNGAISTCKANASSMLEVEQQENIKRFGRSHNYHNATMWVNNFTHIHVGLSLNVWFPNIRCLVLDENGQLRADNCSKSYNSFCVKDSVSTTIRYLGDRNNTIPTYERPNSSTGTTKKGTSGASYKTTSRVSSSSREWSPSKTTSVRNTTSRTADKKESLKMDQDLMIVLIAVGSIVLMVVVLAVCCCCCCKNNDSNDSKNPHLAEAYSETADSIIFKEQRIYDDSEGVSDYATPEDAVGVKRARHRDSIVEGEYDTLQQNKNTKTAPKKKIAVVNAYSHVAIVQPNARTLTSDKYDVANENQYDVTNFSKPVIVTVGNADSGGNIYGHVDSKPT